MTNTDRYSALSRELDLAWLKHEKGHGDLLRLLRDMSLKFRKPPTDIGQIFARFKGYSENTEALRKGKLDPVQAAAMSGLIQPPRSLKEFGYWFRSRSPEAIKADITALPDITIKSKSAAPLPISAGNQVFCCFQGPVYGRTASELAYDVPRNWGVLFRSGWHDYFTPDPRWDPLRSAVNFSAYPADDFYSQNLPSLASEVKPKIQDAERDIYGGRETEKVPISVESFTVKLSQAFYKMIQKVLLWALKEGGNVHGVIHLVLGEKVRQPVPCLCPFSSGDQSESFTVKAVRLYVFELNSGNHECLLANEYIESDLAHP